MSDVSPTDGSEPHHSTLGLPAGSIRAVLALTVFGVAMAVVLLEGPVDDRLWLATTLVLGYYYANRQAQSDDDHQRPLGLPRGSVRWILFLAFASTVGFMAYRWREAGVDIVQQEAFFPLLAVASFFLGRFFKLLTGLFAKAGGTLSGLFNDMEAVIALACAVSVVAVFVFQVEFDGVERVKRATLSFLLFYFGSR